MTILVTGATGRVGRHVVEQLVARSAKVRVLTRDPAWSAPGAETARSPREAVGLAADEAVSVIGGAEIFSLFLPIADSIELTEVDADVEGDTVMPAIAPQMWRETAREDHPSRDGRPAFSFLRLERES